MELPIRFREWIYIHGYLSSRNRRTVSGAIDDSWHGMYEVEEYQQKIIISSTPGVSDINIATEDGKCFYIECKKGREKNRRNSEYLLIREAIRQWMTGCQWNGNFVPVIARPYSEKSYELACRWSQPSRSVWLGFGLCCCEVKVVLIYMENESNGNFEFTEGGKICCN